MVCNDPIKPSNFMKLPSASLLTSNPNTYVQGIFKWYDDNKKFHPLQFNRVELWDKEPVGETLLATTYTNENGFYRFEFVNADKSTDFENGGYDVFVRVLPMGENTRVYKGNGKSYQMDLGYYKDIPTGTLHYVYHNFYMRESAEIDKNIDWDNYDFTFDQALQVSQAVIFASKYAKEMNGENIASVSVRYPHGIKDTGCYYSSGNKTIYIKDPAEEQKVKSYATWDPIMHEYGHHVQSQFNMDKNPCGTHWTSLQMGDHYMYHLHGFPSSSQDWEKNVQIVPQLKVKSKNLNANYKEIE
ncbi:MAG: transthyretin-like family protein [Anaeroplasma bactoclasticum]|nr:transthyretin-like family protein [Anaeroplasma bactoclasticum]